MQTKYYQDVVAMHDHFGHTFAVNGLGPDKLAALLFFRMSFLEEEYDETVKAASAGDSDGIVDGLIDLIVVALGTLDLFKVDADVAWNRVYCANMTKQAGKNASRPNPLGLPDLVKPIDFVAPTHHDNTGLLTIVNYEEFNRLREEGIDGLYESV